MGKGAQLASEIARLRQEHAASMGALTKYTHDLLHLQQDWDKLKKDFVEVAQILDRYRALIPDIKSDDERIYRLRQLIELDGVNNKLIDEITDLRVALREEKEKHEAAEKQPTVGINDLNRNIRQP